MGKFSKKEVIKFLLTMGYDFSEILVIVLAFYIAGKYAFNKGFAPANDYFSKKNAEETLDRFMEELEEIPTVGNTNITRNLHVFSKDYVATEFYEKMNRDIARVENQKDLKDFLATYIPEYMASGNDHLEKENISIVDGDICYDGNFVELDADAKEVLGSLALTYESIPVDLSKDEEQEWMDQVLRKVMASELYEIEESTSKKLVLEPKSIVTK